MFLLFMSALLFQEKSGDDVYSAIAGKIDRAKTLRLKISVEGASRDELGSSLWHSALTLFLKDDNKVRLMIKTRGPVGDTETIYVTDGQTTSAVWKLPERTTRESKDTPCNLVSSLKDSILTGRTELPLKFMFLPPDPQRRNPPRFSCSVKASGSHEDHRILDFKFEPDGTFPRARGISGASSVSLLYDPKTLVPIKRFVHHQRPREPRGLRGCVPSTYIEIWTTETFEEFTLDAAIPDDPFKLPEDKK